MFAPKVSRPAQASPAAASRGTPSSAHRAPAAPMAPLQDLEPPAQQEELQRLADSPRHGQAAGGTPPGAGGDGGDPGKGTSAAALPGSVHEVLRSGRGRPLDPAARAYLEPRFGFNFENIRIHTDELAVRSAHEVHALAYTVGRNIVMRKELYVPHSTAGLRLLAHELTHVVQQVNGLHARRAISEPGDPAEREADHVADQVVDSSASPSIRVARSPGAQLHRQSVGGAPATPSPSVELPDIQERAQVTVSFNGFTVNPAVGTRLMAGPRAEQGIAVVLYALAPNHYTRDLALAVIAEIQRTSGLRGLGNLQGAATQSEPMPREFTVSLGLAMKVVGVLEQRNIPVSLGASQREILVLGEALQWLLEEYAKPAVRQELGITFPAWHTDALKRADAASFGVELRALAAALQAYRKEANPVTQASLRQAMHALLLQLAGASWVLELIRADAELANHPAYRLLWPKQGDAPPKEGAAAGEAIQAAPTGTLAPGEVAPPNEAPHLSLSQAFLAFTRTQKDLVARMADPKTGPAARRQLLDYFIGWVPQLTPAGPADLKVLDKPGMANLKPHPATLKAVPAIQPPLFDASLTADYHFHMQLQFPDVFEAFTRYAFSWSRARIPDEAIKTAADITQVKGQKPTLGEVASLRYRKVGQYAYEDIASTIHVVGEMMGGPPGAQVDVAAINTAMRLLKTSISLGFDLLTTPASEKKIVFPEGPGLYVVRCVAAPVRTGQGYVRAPSVAWLPVFANDPSVMAETRLASAVSQRDRARKRLAEIQKLLEGPGPLPDREALVLEGEALMKVLESFPESLEQQRQTLKKRVEQIDRELAAIDRGEPAKGASRHELERERALLARQLGPITRIQEIRAKRSKEHDLKAAEQLTAVFVSDEGQAMHLALETVPLPVADGAQHWYVSDLTTPKSGDASAYSQTKDDPKKGKPEAILAAVQSILEGHGGYGRGHLAIEIDGKTYKRRIAQSQGGMLMEALENLSTALSIAAIAAAPFTGGASLAILIPVGVVGAVPSAYRIASRLDSGTFQFDLEFAMDVVNIAGSLVGLGQAALPAKALRAGKALMVIGGGVNGLGVVLMGAQMVEQLQSLEDLPPGLRASRVMQIVGNAMVQAGMMVGQHLAERARVKAMEAAIHGSEGTKGAAHEQKSFDAWEQRLNPETREMLQKDPALRDLYRNMDPAVRRALTLCASPCIPTDPPPKAADIARIQQFIQQQGLAPDHPGLREYLHRHRNDLTSALDRLKPVKTAADFQKVLEQSIASFAKSGTAARVNGRWRLTLNNGQVIHEHTVGRHGDLKSVGAEGFFQSHHGVQDAWAKEVGLDTLGGYTRDNCPAILLRDSHIGTPHQRVTARQKNREVGRERRTYADERQNLRNDMAAADVPSDVAEALLRKSDDYFKGVYEAVEARLRGQGLDSNAVDAKLKTLFGDWYPGRP